MSKHEIVEPVTFCNRLKSCCAKKENQLVTNCNQLASIGVI